MCCYIYSIFIFLLLTKTMTTAITTGVVVSASSPQGMVSKFLCVEPYLIILGGSTLNFFLTRSWFPDFNNFVNKILEQYKPPEEVTPTEGEGEGESSSCNVCQIFGDIEPQACSRIICAILLLTLCFTCLLFICKPENCSSTFMQGFMKGFILNFSIGLALLIVDPQLKLPTIMCGALLQGCVGGFAQLWIYFRSTCPCSMC